MEKIKYQPGLSFKKLDLHIHTPASKCFQGNCTPDQIVEVALGNGLDGIAITDHNSGEWVDLVKLAAKNKPLVIFPGVEITCTGGRQNIHIIALLDPSCGTKEVEAILNKLDIQPHEFGKQETVTNSSPIQVIGEICRFGGLAVLAHANSSHGVLNDMSGEPRTRVIQSEYLLAVEATDFNDESKKNSHRRVVDYLDGNDPTYQKKLAVYQASDNPANDNSGMHSHEGIGNRFSYFKVERLNLDSLRQCFIDPDTRIRQENEFRTTTYPLIKKIVVDSGFFEGQEVNFHPGLTSILGAKGAGKSLLIEFLRFALNQEPGNENIYLDHKRKLSLKLEEFGSIEVVIQDEHGKVIKFKRTLRDLEDSPYDSSIPYNPAQFFPVLFLSQNEIIAIAENEDEQLRFIDRFFDFYNYRSRITEIEHKLKKLDQIMADGLRAFVEFDELSSRKQTVENEISKLDEALKDPIFEKYQVIEKKEKFIIHQQECLDQYIDNIGNVKAEILKLATPSIPESLKADPSILRTASFIKDAYNFVVENLSNLSHQLDEINNAADKEYQKWKPIYEKGKTEYENYIQKMGGDYKAIALSRQNFVREYNNILKQMDAVQKRKDLVKNISQNRESLLSELIDKYSSYSEARRSKCEKFMADSEGKLRLQILDQSNVKKFCDSLLSLKRGSYLRDDEIEKITSIVNPREFIISLLRYDATKEMKFLEKVSNDSGIEIKRMKILSDFLLSTIPYEDLLSLQYEAQPQDRPEILYNVGEENFQPLSNISVGQKCTAMLLMALSDGIMPIVIDQPEDSLDIRSIWEDVCKKLRNGKENRQFIFTTHNSSLAVASDTDCYLILEGEATKGNVVHIGSMDHEPVSEEVIKYLEGGRNTYYLKYKKYGENKK
jgi:ABC-type cobalamin/Fe3+-siderophores transport system ATPase subunit